jgi:hypothetical protein
VFDIGDDAFFDTLRFGYAVAEYLRSAFSRDLRDKSTDFRRTDVYR